MNHEHIKAVVPKYVLCPGYVISRYDGQCHYITADQLVMLYRVNKMDCVVQPDLDDLPRSRGWKKPASAIDLYPQYSGDYSLPTI